MPGKQSKKEKVVKVKTGKKKCAWEDMVNLEGRHFTFNKNKMNSIFNVSALQKYEVNYIPVQIMCHAICSQDRSQM